MLLTAEPISQPREGSLIGVADEKATLRGGFFVVCSQEGGARRWAIGKAFLGFASSEVGLQRLKGLALPAMERAHLVGFRIVG